MRRVRWGVLGAARIATHHVIPAMQQSQLAEVVAIASRDQAKARDAAVILGVPRVYGSYEALLADPDLEAVYNPLPNHLHVPWSIRALEAGKHVLCEKPIGLNSAEASQLIAARDRAWAPCLRRSSVSCRYRSVAAVSAETSPQGTSVPVAPS